MATSAADSESAFRNSASNIDGPLFKKLFSDADQLLHRHVEALNAINVFPVPDGDTGTNMHLTLHAGVEELTNPGNRTLSEAAHALAHGTLMGARGNSGVILSQVLRGFDSAFASRETISGADISAAFKGAEDAARSAISQPREGTMLTVIGDVARALAERQPGAALEALDLAVFEANTSVARTPDLLPVLKEAGVVDAGGAGLAIILEGLARSLRGDTLDIDLAPRGSVREDWRTSSALHQEGDEHGYCTEFVINGPGLDAGTVQERLPSFGSSLLVVDGDGLIRVHLHTEDPDAAIAYGRTLGDLSHVKVDNLEEQVSRFAAATPRAPVASSIDIVAVVNGPGIEAAFRGIGMAHPVRGGQTMNPSAGEVLAAIDACGANEVVVLPNNRNIIAAARQAAGKSPKRVAVIPSASVPQGLAAALALNRDLTFDENVDAMERALTTVRSAEVTRAVRDTTIDGRNVRVGQSIGIVEGRIRVVEDDLSSAVHGCLVEMFSEGMSLLTIYSGADVRDAEVDALAESIKVSYPSLEVEPVRGGQAHYPYILSLE
jgi:DAK2 domain fusion protein YloV